MAKGTKFAYFKSTKHPFYGFLSVLPVLVFYELIALNLNQNEQFGIRNAADVLLKEFVFRQLMSWFGIHRLFAYGLVILIVLSIIFWKKYKSDDLSIRAGYFIGMFLESLAYAFFLGPVVSRLTFILQFQLLNLSITPMQLDLPHQVMLSLGAGFYEELFFRVILLSGSAYVFMKLLNLNKTSSFILAALISSVAFSYFHYIGPLADTLTLQSFMFRFFAGIFFAILYVLRGFGIVVYTHALYDLMLVLYGV
ncbi:CPBP family intramembrane metalloprotease [candidate division KSB1 bacterium]|nr:CPBP family intramembrane metalloprotease [candidate division KSB1 bacterium]